MTDTETLWREREAELRRTTLVGQAELFDTAGQGDLFAEGDTVNDLVNTGQPWIKEAIAEQEEHIKRTQSCRGELGRAHSFRAHGVPASDPGIPGKGKRYSACVVCGVTETREDYEAKSV